MFIKGITDQPRVIFFWGKGSFSKGIAFTESNGSGSNLHFRSLFFLNGEDFRIRKMHAKRAWGLFLWSGWKRAFFE